MELIYLNYIKSIAGMTFLTLTDDQCNEIRPLIDKIYVCPNFILIKEEKMECEKEEPFGVVSKFGDIQLIDINKFLPKLYRVVLLGDPGAGKSTFAQKISYDILKDSDKVSPGNCDIPIIVTLRDFQSDNLQKGISILDFIRKEIHSSFQIKASNSTFEYLFLNGYVLLIFDGLDELLDTSLRAKIVDEIESFCTLFPSIPVLVTSRKVGYNQAPLRADMFQIVELAPFEDKQIEEYVNKWFDLDPYLTCGEKERKIKSFLKESRIASDIRSNSLMLSLMCSIYRDENYIPTNRPEVYKKCSEMLFEKWDKNRGISPSILIAKSRVRSLLSYLAYVIFTNETLQKGINENKLIDKAAEYLLETSYENEYDAEEAAKDFINFCKGRAWVLTDTGTTKWGENIYQFTHRTFLEYFTAEWIVRKYEENLCDVLLPRICKGEWDNVSQLAFQIRYEKSEGGDKLFTDLRFCQN
jgi:predicted NACHT family NTPase